MSRQQRAEQARSLRLEGLSCLQIAERMGLSYSYACELLDDPNGLKVRARRESYRGTCMDCGSPTCGNDGRAKAPVRCRACEYVVRPARHSALMVARYGEQREQLAAMYRDGLTLREIADALDSTVSAVGVMLHRLRHRYGYDLPYRYAQRDGKRVAA